MPESAFEYLASHELLTIATASSDGRPHAAPSFYVLDGRSVLFSTADSTETARNLAANGTASIAVADAPDPGEDWSHARGLQITGTVSRLDGAAADAAAAAFRSSYSHLGDELTSAPFYRLDPTEIHYIHNDEAGDDTSIALGVSWVRETVD